MKTILLFLLMINCAYSQLSYPNAGITLYSEAIWDYEPLININPNGFVFQNIYPPIDNGWNTIDTWDPVEVWTPDIRRDRRPQRQVYPVVINITNVYQTLINNYEYETYQSYRFPGVTNVRRIPNQF